VQSLIEAPPGGTIYTNDQRIALALQLHDKRLPVRLIPQYDILYELAQLSNRDNGQYEVILGVLERRFLGGVIWPCAFENVALSIHDRFVTNRDGRLDLTISKSFWKKYTRPVEQRDEYEIRAPIAGMPRITMEPPPNLIDPSILNAPCR
jgi:hypothetical protein